MSGDLRDWLSPEQLLRLEIALVAITRFVGSFSDALTACRLVENYVLSGSLEPRGCSTQERSCAGDPVTPPEDVAATDDLARRLEDLLRELVAAGSPCPTTAEAADALGAHPLDITAAFASLESAGRIEINRHNNRRRVRFPGGTWSAWNGRGPTPPYDDDGKPVKILPLADDLFRLLSEVVAAGAPCPSVAKAAESLNRSGPAVASAFKDLLQEGRIKVEEKGRFRRVRIYGNWSEWSGVQPVAAPIADPTRRGDGCRWISGDPKHGGSACGKPVQPGKPYCAEHAARAYRPEMKRMGAGK